MAASISKEEKTQLLETLQQRFEETPDRHRGLTWQEVQTRIQKSPKKLATLHQMEATGGEPDVIRFDENSAGELTFVDCAKESPGGRRSVCYDREALESRKKFKPENCAIDLAAKIGIEILTEAQYRELQTYGEFDLKTSSWIQTPEEIRQLGGALFCDRRYNQVFLYHNGAESYYAARGFRGLLRI